MMQGTASSECWGEGGGGKVGGGEGEPLGAFLSFSLSCQYRLTATSDIFPALSLASSFLVSSFFCCD